ncbi:Papilin [Clonorchis sinensis]|uniref:Papilin n=1 Tax=Clonorchis sinensis TaxID=79923 RepID=A0A3R7FAC1_CLOSI|nr:Papilin [Clonorchis sinensis]
MTSLSTSHNNATHLLLPLDKCTEKPDPRRCKTSSEKFYFDGGKQECKTFTYDGSGGNKNKHDSKEQCEKTCKVTPVYPGRPKDTVQLSHSHWESSAMALHETHGNRNLRRSNYWFHIRNIIFFIKLQANFAPVPSSYCVLPLWHAGFSGSETVSSGTK